MIPTLLDSVRLLRSMSVAAEEPFRLRIAKIFGDEYIRLFKEHKVAYLNRVLDQQMFRDSEVSKLLGYSSRSAVDAMRDGKISHEKFELLRTTLGSRVPLETPNQRKLLTLVQTVTTVRKEILKQGVETPLTAEGCQWLEQIFCEDLTLRELECEGEFAAWIKTITRRVKAVYPSAAELKEESLSRLVLDWGPSYLRTRCALAQLLGDHS